MIFDLHVHTKDGSPDSSVDPYEVVRVAKERGLDGICITEHGNTKSKLADILREKYDFLVIGGMEASTELGDLLIFGLGSYPRNIYHAAEIKPLVDEVGGVMIAAHPFRSYLGCRLTDDPMLEEKLTEGCKRQVFQMVDAMEVINGWSSREDVLFCQEVSRRLNMRGTGGSDAHMMRQIGCCVTIFNNGIRSEADLIEALKQDKFTAEDRRTWDQKGYMNWFT